MDLEQISEIDPEAVSKREAKQLVKQLAYRIMYIDYCMEFSELDGVEYMRQFYGSLLVRAGYAREDGGPGYSIASIHNHAQQINDLQWRSREGIAYLALKHDWMLTTEALKIARDAMKHDPGAVTDLMVVLKRRAAMMGYDAPQQLQISAAGGDEVVTEQDRQRIQKARDEALDFESQMLGAGTTIEGELVE